MEAPGTLLRRHGLRPKKTWGQNFLADPSVLAGLAAACGAEPDGTIVELGAGLGHLTDALLATGARVVAVERDREVAAVLRDVLGGRPRLTVVEANAACVSIAQLAGGPAIVAGNLPYHLTTPILFHLLEQRLDIPRIVLTLQAEVVERLAARPGGSGRGVLSVQTQALCEVEPLFPISAEAFHPRPAVGSAAVRLTPLPRPRAELAGTPIFARVVRAAFGQRRKTLANALSGGGLPQVREALVAAAIDGTRRAETLSTEEFGRLAAVFAGGSPGSCSEPASRSPPSASTPK